MAYAHNVLGYQSIAYVFTSSTDFLLLTALVSAIGPVHVVTTSVVPAVSNMSYSIVSQYHSSVSTAIPVDHAQAYFTAAGFEGYILGQFVIALLKRLSSTGNVSSSALVQAMMDLSYFSFNGVTLGPISPICHQGMREVFGQELLLQQQQQWVGFSYTFPTRDLCHADRQKLQKFWIFGQSGDLTGPNKVSGIQAIQALVKTL